jgi:hypothetical protein
VGGKLKRETIRERVATTQRRGQGGKGRKPITRSFRTSFGKVTVELKKGLGADALVSAAEEVVRLIRDELSADDQAAA